MKKIIDYKEVSPLVLRYFKRGVITNNFLGAEDYKAEIKEGRLFFAEGEDSLNLYVRRDEFYEFYFYALSESVAFPEFSEPLIADVVGNGAKVLENNGFFKILERVKLEINSNTDSMVAGKKSEKADAVEIFSLLKNSFNEFTGYIPNFSQVEKECEEGYFYKYSENGKIAGALRWGKTGKTAQIKHLCVSDKFRGMGIGKSLTKDFLTENPKAIVWTGKENTAAIKLYKSFGFSESNIESTVYRKDV